MKTVCIILLRDKLPIHSEVRGFPITDVPRLILHNGRMYIRTSVEDSIYQYEFVEPVTI